MLLTCWPRKHEDLAPRHGGIQLSPQCWGSQPAEDTDEPQLVRNNKAGSSRRKDFQATHACVHALTTHTYFKYTRREAEKTGQWFTPLILALGRLRREDHEFEVNLGYKATSHLKTTKNITKQDWWRVSGGQQDQFEIMLSYVRDVGQLPEILSQATTIKPHTETNKKEKKSQASISSIRNG